MAVTCQPNVPANIATATSLTKGDVMRNAKVTPNGMPPLTNPMKSGMLEQEQKVYKVLTTDIRKLLSQEQRQAMAAAREVARTVSSGCMSTSVVHRRLDGKLPSRLLSRCLRSIVARYKPLRKEVRLHNKALGEQKKASKPQGRAQDAQDAQDASQAAKTTSKTSTAKASKTATSKSSSKSSKASK